MLVFQHFLSVQAFDILDHMSQYHSGNFGDLRSASLMERDGRESVQQLDEAK